MKYFCGIDPGQKGALAIISEDLKKVRVWDYPGDYLGVLGLFCGEPTSLYKVALIAVEKQSPASGRTSSLSIGRNYGEWLMFCAWLGKLHDVQHTIVSPANWQRAVFDSAKKDKDVKLVSMANAARRFPSVELYGPRGGKLDGRADALNIALYARKVFLNG